MGEEYGEARTANIDIEDACTALVKAFKQGPFVPLDAAVALNKSIAETLEILAYLHTIGCCRCPVNDGGINLFQMSPQVFRENGGVQR